MGEELNKVDEVLDESVETIENNNTDIEDSKPDEKMFTQEEVNKMVQDRLKREQKQFESKFKKEQLESEKLAKMSEADKHKALMEQEKLEFENEKKAFFKDKMETEIIKQLAEKNIPTEFAKFLVTDDAESTKDNLTSLDNLLETYKQDYLSKELHNKLNSNSIKPLNGNGSIKTVTKEDLGKMTYSERLDFAVSNPEEFQALYAK